MAIGPKSADVAPKSVSGQVSQIPGQRLRAKFGNFGPRVLGAHLCMGVWGCWRWEDLGRGSGSCYPPGVRCRGSPQGRRIPIDADVVASSLVEASAAFVPRRGLGR